MIIDKLENAHKYYFLGDNFKKSFEFLQNTDLKTLECKKHVIDGENIWANVQEMPTKNPETTAWEIHRKYTDIQYVISGYESMHWTNLDNFLPEDEFNTENDIQFGEIKKDCAFAKLDVKEGYFVVFTPDDVHKPALFETEENTVKKIIVKVS